MSSDHGIVTAKIRLSLQRNASQTTLTTRHECSLLNNRDISDKYTITLRNKFDALQEISERLTPIDEYENFVNAHVETAVEFIPFKQRSEHRVLWEILAAKKKRDDMKTVSLCNKINPTKANAQKLKKA